MLTKDAEAELLKEARAAGDKEGGTLRDQSRHRLLALEAELQESLDTFLSQIREHLLSRLHEEIGALSASLEVKLTEAQREATPVADDMASANHLEEDKATREDARQGQAEPPVTLPSEDSSASRQEVGLYIEPPLSPSSLLQFYRCLWQTRDVCIVRAEGSASEGVKLALRLTDPTALFRILDEIPWVGEVREDGVGGKGNHGSLLRVGLKASLPTKKLEKHEPS